MNPNKFYKVITNGIPSYQVIPFKDAADEQNLMRQGYQPVTQSEYMAGQQQEIQRLSALGANRPDIVQAISGINADLAKYQNIPPTSTEAGSSGYMTDPSGAFRTQQSYDALQANKAGVAAGTMSEVQPGMYVPTGSAAELNITKPAEYQAKYGSGTYDEKGVPMTPPTPSITPGVTPPTSLPATSSGTSSPITQNQPVTPPAQGSSLNLGGQEAAPFGMSSLQRGPGQGMTQAPSSGGSVAPVQASITGGGSGGSLAGTMTQQRTSGGGAMAAAPKNSWESSGVPPTQPMTSPQQGMTAPRSFPGLSADQVAQLDKAWLRGQTGQASASNAGDKANVDYAIKRFGYTPPSQTQTASPITPAAPTVQQPTNGRLLKPSEWSTFREQGITEEDVTRLGNDIYLKPNSRFTVGGTGEGLGSGMVPPDTSSSSSSLSVKTGGMGDPTQEEIDAGKLRDSLENDINNLNQSARLGLTDINDQAISMPFLTGQSASLERRANDLIAGKVGQMETLEKKLARLQAERQNKMQAALDVSSKEEARNAPVKPVEVSSGASLINPVTGEVIYGGEQKKTNLVKSTYKGVTTFYDPTTGEKVVPGASGSSGTTSGSTPPLTLSQKQQLDIAAKRGNPEDVKNVQFAMRSLGYVAPAGSRVPSVAAVRPVTSSPTRTTTRSTTTPKQTTKVMEKKVNQYLGSVIGADNKVSPDDYNRAKNAWIKDGGNPTLFDTRFKGYKNPTNKYY